MLHLYTLFYINVYIFIDYLQFPHEQPGLHKIMLTFACMKSSFYLKNVCVRVCVSQQGRECLLKNPLTTFKEVYFFF